MERTTTNEDDNDENVMPSTMSGYSDTAEASADMSSKVKYIYVGVISRPTC